MGSEMCIRDRYDIPLSINDDSITDIDNEPSKFGSHKRNIGSFNLFISVDAATNTSDTLVN